MELSESVFSTIELVVSSVWVVGYSKKNLGGNAQWWLSNGGMLRLVI
jgi:hypothetical protein